MQGKRKQSSKGVEREKGSTNERGGRQRRREKKRDFGGIQIKILYYYKPYIPISIMNTEKSYRRTK